MIFRVPTVIVQNLQETEDSEKNNASSNLKPQSMKIRKRILCNKKNGVNLSKPFLVSKQEKEKEANYICSYCRTKIVLYDKIPLCSNCLIDLSSTKFEISLFTEEDAFEVISKRQRIGNCFQAQIPEILAEKKGCEFLNDNHFIKMNQGEQKFNEENLNKFRNKIQSLFSGVKFSEETIFYILAVFKYEMERCLNYLSQHKKGWLAFFKSINKQI